MMKYLKDFNQINEAKAENGVATFLKSPFANDVDMGIQLADSQNVNVKEVAKVIVNSWKVPLLKNIKDGFVLETDSTGEMVREMKFIEFWGKTYTIGVTMSYFPRTNTKPLKYGNSSFTSVNHDNYNDTLYDVQKDLDMENDVDEKTLLKDMNIMIKNYNKFITSKTMIGHIELSINIEIEKFQNAEKDM